MLSIVITLRERRILEQYLVSIKHICQKDNPITKRTNTGTKLFSHLSKNTFQEGSYAQLVSQEDTSTPCQIRLLLYTRR